MDSKPSSPIASVVCTGNGNRYARVAGKFFRLCCKTSELRRNVKVDAGEVLVDYQYDH